MAKDVKYVRIYPYQYKIVGIENKPETLFEEFKRENSNKNIIVHYAFINPLLLVVEKIRNDFVFGKFLKLRKDAPSILNRLSGEEKLIDLLEDEDIIEVSHFIMNTKDNLLFAEYNFHAVRIFARPLTNYLNKKFEVKENEVLPIPLKDTLKKLEKEKIIKSFEVKLSNYQAKIIEEELNFSPTKLFKRLSGDDRSTIRIIVTKGIKKQTLDKEETLKLAKELMDKPLEALKIRTKNVLYDLISDTFLFFIINVEKSGRYIDSDDFYEKVAELYLDKSPSLKEELKELK